MSETGWPPPAAPPLPPPAWPAPAGPPWPAPPASAGTPGTPAAQATPAPWWDLDRSLRARLTAIVALAVAVAIAGAVGIAYVTVRRDLNGAVDTQLRRQTLDLQQQAVRTRGIGVQLQTGVGGYVQVVDATGGVQQPDVQRGVDFPVRPADIDVARGARTQVWRNDVVDGVRVRVLTSRLLPGIGYAVQVAVPLTTVREQLRRLAARFAVLFLAGLAVAMALAWAVSRTALVPVTNLTGAAERIADTRDLTLRIDETRQDELGRLASSFNTMLQALEQSVGAQRQLVADASHELRTPLASLRTNVEVLQRIDELPDDVRDEVLTAIVGQVDELTALVSDVVELARGDEPVESYQPVAFDELVENAVDRAKRHWRTATFDLHTEPVTVSGVARRIDRAVTNLLDNAAKFSGPGARVEVRLDAHGALTVRDHGPGVPADALPHVFGRFYRADEARSLPGSGLGLAIVKQSVESHGGTVSLRNAEGGGTLAELRLPPA